DGIRDLIVTGVQTCALPICELTLFDPELGARPQVVVGNKLDLAESRENLARVEHEIRRRGLEFFGISAATGAGTRELVARLCAQIGRASCRERGYGVVGGGS